MRNLPAIILGIFLLYTAASCSLDEDFIVDADAKLEFSLDTLRFDTVFTELGSATRSFKIYNRYNRPIRIAKISFQGLSQTQFRMNVDGIPGRVIENVEIAARDSIYLFAEVTINPNQPLSASPFVIEEKIQFETNGNTQSVLLVAWGQNANYFPSRFNKGVPVVLSCRNNEISWSDPKPYVIYGEVFIDSCTLNIPAGTRIYVHGGIARNEFFGVFNDGILYMLPNGRLRMLGTKEKPIIVQGSRLEKEFAEEPGQWLGIILGKGSKGHQIEYTTIKNGILGVYADSASDLTLRNSRIYNTSGNGLIGVRSRITADNCLIYNNASNSVSLAFGGDYAFNYCTVASYGVNASALSATNFICYDDPLVCRQRSSYRMNALFRNCIFYGSQKDQLRFNDVSGGEPSSMFNVKFENCIVRVEELLKAQHPRFSRFFQEMGTDCINGKPTDKIFKNPDKDIYLPDSLSIAFGKGKPVTSPRAILIDLDNNARSGSAPTIGCYEK
ncbi:MAG: hypothetical protein RL386_743 [Bacteroidota bacterium]|jgi:hypothetical protein